jgi:transcriptional regulator with GAF, ATPase, and Fis domain
VATNRDLEKKIGDGAFRNDLYYRLRTHQVYVPPLRERPEDIPLLFQHFLEKASHELGKNSPEYPPELTSLLSSYHFPGNVRELETMVFDAVARHRRGMLAMDSFRKRVEQDPHGSHERRTSPLQGTTNLLSGMTQPFPTLSEAEEYLISEALRLSGNKQGAAASMLGITRQALNKRLNRKGGGK